MQQRWRLHRCAEWVTCSFGARLRLVGGLYLWCCGSLCILEKRVGKKKEQARLRVVLPGWSGFDCSERCRPDENRILAAVVSTDKVVGLRVLVNPTARLGSAVEGNFAYRLACVKDSFLGYFDQVELYVLLG